ncbi:MAG: hypothetical protein JW849_11860 [Phycisphaerae bacterium]|nr:hypothetical protein [Phycisphaerae bacterium]
MTSAWRMILTVGLLSGLGWADAQPTVKPAGKPPHLAGKYHQAYREGFQPPADADAEARRMRELIEKINRTSLPKHLPEPKAPPPPVQPQTPAPAAAPQPAAAPPPPVLSTEMLRDLARRVPRSVADPIRLGDALYHGGHYAQALCVYKDAMKNTKNKDDQVWLLYQMGCCLKDAKPAEARNYFQQVRQTLPDSPWSRMAEMQIDLLDWTELNQPVQFLEDLQRDLQPQDERIEESRQTRPRTGEKKTSSGSGASGSSSSAALRSPQAKAEPAQAQKAKPKK